MVLSNKKLKLKLRIELAKRAQKEALPSSLPGTTRKQRLRTKRAKRPHQQALPSSLPGKTLKQTRRIELVKRAQQQALPSSLPGILPTPHPSTLPGILPTPPSSLNHGSTFNPVRTALSKREKKRQRKQMPASDGPEAPQVGETQAGDPRMERLGRDKVSGAVEDGGTAIPSSEIGEDSGVVDITEMERYYHCIQKVLNKHGEDDKSAEAEERHGEDQVVVIDAAVHPEPQAVRSKKRKRKADGEATQGDVGTLKDVNEAEDTRNKKKKNKARVKLDMKSDNQVERVTESTGKKLDVEETVKNFGRLHDVPVRKEAGKNSTHKKNNEENHEKQRMEESQSQEKQPKGGLKHTDNDQSHQYSQSAEAEVSSDSKKVYVGGIPYYSSEDDIRMFFRECGTITGMDCKVFPDSGKFRGIALITFKTEAAAQRAIALDGADMGGRFLKVQPCVAKPQESAKKEMYKEPPSKTQGYTTAYVGNLSWDITEEDLRGFLKDCKVDAIRFALDKTTGDFRGYGHIDFADDQSLELALQLDQELLLGRPIKIAYAVPKRDGNNMEKTQRPLSGKRGKACHSCGKPEHISSQCPNRRRT